MSPQPGSSKLSFKKQKLRGVNQPPKGRDGTASIFGTCNTDFCQSGCTYCTECPTERNCPTTT